MKILICIAGMPHATPTIRFGGLIAKHYAADVTLLTVLGRNTPKETASEWFDEARSLLPGMTIELVVRRGKPGKEIVRESRQNQHDLLVIGDRSSGPTDLFLSSVVRQVVREACAPVLVVKRERQALQRILICTGGRSVAEPVIRTGARLAQAAGASVTLLHVTTPLPTMYTGLQTMEEHLWELLQTNSRVARNLRRGVSILDEHDLAAEIKLRHGVAAQEILLEAEQGDYDLIVIHNGTRKNWFRRLWTDSVAQEVVDNAHRPVLAVCQAPRQGRKG